MREVRLADGRRLDVYDDGGDGPALLWHIGSPQTGRLLDPLVRAARVRGLRLVSYGRPGYAGSTAQPGRDVAAAAADVAQLCDALGIGEFATAGASGGGPHALACAARLGERVTGVVCVASVAPVFPGWLDGMHAPGALASARNGRDARAAFKEEFDPETFTAADWAALERDWASLGEDAVRAQQLGLDGLIDDDTAFAKPWGFDLEAVTAPVLLVHGGEDRMVPPSHSHALLAALPAAELWLRPRDGHVSVLNACPVALDWLYAPMR